MTTHRRALRLLAPALAAILSVAVPPSTRSQAPRPLSVLTVGGGPTPRMNQVAIESNVRYVHGLLPPAADKTVLFADGSPQTQSVIYLGPPVSLSRAELAFRFLAGESLTDHPEKFRAPNLPQINGPASKTGVGEATDTLAAKSNRRYLLYFTGHGDKARSRDLNNNVYDLWNRETLSVREMAAQVRKLPRDAPVVLVMVQCYSGAFGNLLFEGGDPSAPITGRDLCGFFAAVKERMAAGCTPELNEAEYHDFTSYFFAALSGRDRLGRIITPPDYDKNGRVGMDEAFAYAQITGPSIDVPVCTSDVFLRREVSLTDDAVAATPFSRVLAAATPAQRAALEGLSRSLGASGKNRLKTALREVRHRDETGETTGTEAFRVPEHLVSLRGRWRAQLQEQVPEIARGPRSPEWPTARASAIAYLEKQDTKLEPLITAGRELSALAERRYADQIRGARWLRLVRVAKSVVLAKRLRATGGAARIARFDRLLAAEARNPLRSAD